MEKVTVKNKVPRYIKIAIDIAQRIVNKEFVEGDKIKGRSTLASEYNVSPETIRRAASLLEDMEVVKIWEKSGIYITSSTQAHVLIKRFSKKNDLRERRNLLKKLRLEKANLEKEIEENLDSLLEYTLGQNKVNLGASYELIVPNKSYVVGKTTNELKFWYNTGATITAVKRASELFISPGPHMSFLPEDIVYFVCTQESFQKVKDFIMNEEEIQ